MRFYCIWCLLIVAALLVASAAANPMNENFEELNSDSQSRTWTAVQDFFRPMYTWFRTELPKKTPQDIAKNIQNVAQDTKQWAEDSTFVQGAVDTLRPVGQWFKDTANTLKDKTFREMYDDSRTAVSKVDNSVGSWIEENVDK